MIFQYENLVVGGSFEAVYFAFREGFPIVYKDSEKPYEGEKIGSENKKELYEKMLFCLSISNLNPFANKVENLRIEGNEIFVSGKRPWIEKIEAVNVHNFVGSESEMFTVVDWINVRSCGKHEYKILKSKDFFVKEILFYPSDRVKRTKLFSVKEKNKQAFFDIPKDIKAVSYLTKNQLANEEFSPVYSRIKARQMMKDSGIRGKKTRLSKPNERATIKLEFFKREVFRKTKKIDFKDFKLESKDPYIQLIQDYFNETSKRRNK